MKLSAATRRESRLSQPPARPCRTSPRTAPHGHRRRRSRGIHQAAFLEPLFAALGWEPGDLRKEFHIAGDQCDYLLERQRPLLFVEAKRFPAISKKDTEKDLFATHSEQVLRFVEVIAPQTVSA